MGKARFSLIIATAILLLSFVSLTSASYQYKDDYNFNYNYYKGYDTVYHDSDYWDTFRSDGYYGYNSGYRMHQFSSPLILYEGEKISSFDKEVVYISHYNYHGPYYRYYQHDYYPMRYSYARYDGMQQRYYFD